MVQRLDGSYMFGDDNIDERPPTEGAVCGRKTSPMTLKYMPHFWAFG